MMMNIWRCSVLLAVVAISFVVSDDCEDQELYHSLGPKISPCKKEVILQKGENYTLKCQGNTFLKFVKQEGQEENIGPFTIVNRTKTYNNTEFKYEISLDLINVDLYAVGYYACIKASVEEDLVNFLTEEPSNTENVAYIYIYVNGTDSLFAPMLEMVTGKCDYYVVECRPSTPDVDVKLFVANKTAEYLKYSPKIGFLLKKCSKFSYYCHGYGGYNKTDKKYIRKRTNPPQPTVTSADERYLQGESFHINCTVKYSTKGAVDLEWIIPPGAVVNITTNNNETVKNNDIIYRNISVLNANEAHAGTYVCKSKGHCNGTATDTTIKTFLTTSQLEIKPLSEKKEQINKYYYKRISRQKNNAFEVEIVKSYPPPTCTMILNGSILPNNETFNYKYSTETHICSFSLKKRSIYDSGNYTMVVSNGFDNKNVTFELIFTQNPIYDYVTNHTCILNTKTSIASEITGYPMPVVTWFFIDGSNQQLEVPSEETILSQFKIRSVVKMDCVASGQLFSKATSSFKTIRYFGNQTRWVHVDEIADGFGITYNEAKETSIWVTEKADIIIKCLASSYKFSNVSWSLDGLEIYNTPSINEIYRNNSFSVISELFIRSIAVQDSRIYTCHGFGNDDTEKNDTISVNVAELQEPVVLLTHNIAGQMEKNQKIEINCAAHGVPRPSIQWFKDNEPLVLKAHEIKVYVVNRTSVNSSIIIDHVKDEDRGTYECYANNTQGRDEQNVVVNFKEASTPTAYIVTIIVIIVIFIILIIYLSCRVRKDKQFRKELAAAGLLYFNEGVTKSINPEIGIDEQAELLPYDLKFEFPPDKLVYGKQLGAGAFGVVYKAEARGIINAEETTPVAVKMVKKTADNMYIKALASELKIMVHLGKHINIVNLLGACTKNVGKRELVVIVEYCKFGNIHNYMQRHREVFIDQFSDTKRDNNFGRVNRGYDTTGSTGFQSDYGTANTLETVLTNNTNRTCRKNVRKQPKEVDKVSEGYVMAQPEWRSNYESDYSYDGRSPRPLSSQDLLAWAFQIARGMEYLAGRKVLHGDLAARNILLADDNIVKICDFGLARSIYKNDEYQKKENSPLPVKWLAIECMTDRIFSTQSDVWSFGIVLWEMFSLAKTPYPNIGPADLLRFLTDGNRLSKPAYSDDRIYDLMKRCWEQKPTTRPSFTQLQAILGSFLEDNVRSHYVDLNATYVDQNQKTAADGQEDYLDMIRAPDYNNLVTPSPHHYVNQTNQFFPPSPAKLDEEGYLQMSPANSHNIFSPKSTVTKFDFDPVNFNSRPSEASNGGSELTPMLTLNNLQRSGSDSDHESNNIPNTCPKIDEVSDEVFKCNEKNILNGAVTNPTYITLDMDMKKPPLDGNNYVNVVPNGLVK